jgi:hypothetical protein
MLKLIIDWFSRNKINKHPLSFQNNATWRSELLLPSIFNIKSPYREGYTHADCVIGNFTTGKRGKGDIRLLPNGVQFIVLEAKLFSNFSKGVAKAPNYNQVARTIACMSYTITIESNNLNNFKSIAYYAIVPKSKKDNMTFNNYCDKTKIKDSVKSRIELFKDYKEKYDYMVNWYYTDFNQFMKKINIKIITWEDLILEITEKDIESGVDLKSFYEKCLKYNKK